MCVFCARLCACWVQAFVRVGRKAVRVGGGFGRLGGFSGFGGSGGFGGASGFGGFADFGLLLFAFLVVFAGLAAATETEPNANLLIQSKGVAGWAGCGEGGVVSTDGRPPRQVDQRQLNETTRFNPDRLEGLA